MINNFESAKCLYNLEQVNDSAHNLAKEINEHYENKECVILYLLNGSVVFVGQLLPYLSMSTQIDYIHATRYEKTHPGELSILAEPRIDLDGKDVLILDDIFDRGVTLNAVYDYCLEKGARSVESAVLVYKELENPLERGQVRLPKFCALTTPDYFLFGCGMDLGGYGRNAPGIYYFDEGNL